MAENAKIPVRSEVPEKYKWNLSKLFKDDTAWEEGLKQFEKMIPEIETYKGTLDQSAESIKSCLDYIYKLGLLEESLGNYAFLKTAEDAGNSEYQAMMGRFMGIYSKSEAVSSFLRPELLSIPEAKMNVFLKNSLLSEYQIVLNKILRFKPHILSAAEEKLLALQAEANETAQKSFSALTDVDMEFGFIETPQGKVPLSNSSFGSLMLHPDRKIRKKAYLQFYNGFEKHKNVIASLYGGSVHLDIYNAKVRNQESARAAALFPDKVPGEVYDNLVSAVHNNLDSLHEYYRFRKTALNIEELRHYDVYVPIVKDIKVNHTYQEAVDVIVPSLAPLGEEYCSIVKEGLLGRWVDRYENKGKHSGAFSSGSYGSDPNILMNYKEDVLSDVFTLAHEAGHSMHSLYSVQNNPFQHYNYTIFEAEVASTFNEQLLAKKMLDEADNKEMRAYIIGKLLDDIIANIYRQTMFAEFEDTCHKMVEKGTPLTVDSLRSTYRSLLKQYFGPDMCFEDVSDLEGLRIPHFYRAFYVYKYATGLSAAIALSGRVLSGGDKERAAYLNFLKSGGSKYPLESLKLAGVDMSNPEPVQEALAQFKELLKQLKELM